jgi:hypothetical protein
MMPVMMRFWLPHGGGGIVIPPGDDYTCVDPNLLCNFSTNGAIDGTSPEIAPDEYTTYSSASAVATDGFVSPANFDVIIDGDTVRTFTSLVQAYVHSGETVKVAFKTTSITDDSGTIVSVEFVVGGDCTLSYETYDSGVLGTQITDTFSIGSSSATVLVYIEIVEETAINLYLSPDFDTPAATLASPVDPPFVAYFDWASIRVTSTGNNSAVDYIRCCGVGGIEEG